MNIQSLLYRVVLIVLVVSPIARAADFTRQESVNTPYAESEHIRQLAGKWELSEGEYRRYMDIMQGPLSRWNPELDPIFALGLFASSASEQKRYAEMLAKQEYELTLRTIEFERVYREAFKRLYPDVSMVERTLLEPYYQKKLNQSGFSDNDSKSILSSSFIAGDRILYFPDIDCHDCGKKLNAIINMIENVDDVLIDVYVNHAKTDAEVNQWAMNNHIDVSIVGNKITLNRDNDLYHRIKSQNVDIINRRLFLSRNHQIYYIDEYQIGL